MMLHVGVRIEVAVLVVVVVVVVVLLLAKDGVGSTWVPLGNTALSLFNEAVMMYETWEAELKTVVCRA
jgi:hypothetical protein